MVQTPLFYRRMTLQTATALKPNLAIDQHIEPSITKPLLWQAWTFHGALLGAAFRSAPTGSTKLRAVGHAFRQALWARSRLMQDAWQAARRLV
jgi:hypothetical protein